MKSPFKMSGFGSKSPLKQTLFTGSTWPNLPEKEVEKTEWEPLQDKRLIAVQKVKNKMAREEGKKVTYEQAWDAMDYSERKKHGSDFETFKTAAIKWNLENPGVDAEGSSKSLWKFD